MERVEVFLDYRSPLPHRTTASTGSSEKARIVHPPDSLPRSVCPAPDNWPIIATTRTIPTSLNTSGNPPRGVSRRQFLALAAGTGAAVAVGPMLPAVSTPAPGYRLVPSALRMESATTPLGVDIARPRLDWQLLSSRCKRRSEGDYFVRASGATKQPRKRYRRRHETVSQSDVESPQKSTSENRECGSTEHQRSIRV